MRKILVEKIKESLLSAAPIAVLVIILSVTVVEIETGIIFLFIVGALMLILGMSLFTFGAEIAMMPMGRSVGSFLSTTSKRKFPFVLFICFVIGFVITIAEPDLQVLAGQLNPGEGVNHVLLLSVAAGVGIFLAVSIIRTFFKVRLTYILLVCYTILFILAIFFVPKDFIAVAFDSGGVTTGPITVPFLMAFGIGLAAARGPQATNEDSFGTIALCSIGPILAVMILGMTGLSEAGYDTGVDIVITSAWEGLQLFGHGFVVNMKEIGMALGAILIIFIIFQATVLRIHKEELIRIAGGFLLTFIGLTIFLTGVNVGFMPLGKLLGAELALKSYNYILVPIGMLMGCLIVLAEPAIYILNKQVEEITGGLISRRAMLICLCAGVSLAVGLAMLRVLTGISIWWFLVPAYAAALVLMFIVPKTLTGIAFDSGGVASGPMTATFLLPFAMGACIALDGDVLTDAFGLVAYVAMMPILSIQMLGYLYKIKTKAGRRIDKLRKKIEQRKLSSK